MAYAYSNYHYEDRRRRSGYGKRHKRGMRVHFANDLDRPTSVMWRDQPYGTLRAGETISNHEWYVYDDHTGEPLSDFEIEEGKTSYSSGGRRSRRSRARRRMEWPRRRSRKRGYYSDYGSDNDYHGRVLKDMSYLSRPWINADRGPLIHYMWEAGHVGLQQRAPGGYTLETLSNRPRIFLIKNFMTSQECEMVSDYAHNQGFSRSLVSSWKGISRDRTSSTCWLRHYENGQLGDIFERAARILKIDRSMMRRVAEDFQVVHYSPGQKNGPHHDYLSLDDSGNDRMATLLVYLKPRDTYGGGATRFFHAGRSVKGEQGDAILFYSMVPDGNLDLESQHSGEPLTWGSKEIMTLWVWDKQRVD